jgi:hypothetical protein
MGEEDSFFSHKKSPAELAAGLKNEIADVWAKAFLESECSLSKFEASAKNKT